ncbi:MAG: hypothetical protein KA763_12115 [Xanthomonadales bacterium]|nr:hypothetical protein [Xanthomonadales bacterium]
MWRIRGWLVLMSIVPHCAAATLQHDATLAPGVSGEPEGNDLFGSSVALAGDVLVVGAFSDEIALLPGQSDAGNVGSVYVFRRVGPVWQFEQRLVAPDAEAGGWFGFDVATDAGRLLVGAPMHDTPAPGTGGLIGDQGAAYVYRHDGGGWVLEQKLVPQVALGAFAHFGHAVALQDDTAIIGIPDWGGGGADAFVRDANAQWTHQARLLATTPYSGPNAFGRAVALDGVTVVIGAPTEDNGGISNSDSGAAYVFTRSGQTWSQQARLLPVPSASGQAFGEAVAVLGDRALVAARDETVNGLGSAGAAYDFRRNAGSWGAASRLTAAAPGLSFRFGISLALVGQRAVIGSYWQSGDGGSQQGAAQVFDDGGSGFAFTQMLIAPPTTRGAFNQFASDVAASGARVAIGEPGFDGSSFNAGRAHVYLDAAAAVFHDGFE